jgi:hypothetical protein
MTRKKANNKKNNGKAQGETSRAIARALKKNQGVSPPGGRTFGYKTKLIPASRYINAIRNPFSAEAAGVKVPDFDGNPSFTVASKDLYTIATNSDGNAGWIMNFGFPSSRNVVAASITTPGVVTIYNGTTTAWTDYTGLLSATNSVTSRSVVGGFKINNLCSLAGSTAAQGRLVIAPVSANLANYIINTNASTYSEAQLRRMPGAMVIPLASLAASGKPVWGISGPLDPTALTYFIPGISISTSYNDCPNNIAYMCVVIGGPASTSILEVEQITHWEALPQLATGSLATSGTTISYAALEQAMNFVQSGDLLHYAENAANFVSQIMSSGIAGYLMNG